jgi:hypothetical protein
MRLSARAEFRKNLIRLTFIISGSSNRHSLAYVTDN